MKRDVIIGIDAGTSLMKAVAFSADGDELAIASRPNEVQHSAGGHAEQDMAFTWDSLAAVLRELGERVPDLRQRAAALALTGQGDGTWLVDRDGQPVGAAILWLDGRSGELVRAWRESGIGVQVSAITGNGMNTAQQHAQLAWLQRHEPQRLARAYRVLHCKDWLYLCCTGRYGTDLAEGLFTFGNPRTMAYDTRVLELLGISELVRLLPPVVDGRREHAPLIAAAAQATGLPEGLPVVLAPMDVPSAALGAGLYAPGRSVGCSILGSTGMHARLYTDLDAIPRMSAPKTPAASAPRGGAPVLGRPGDRQGQQGYLWAFATPGSFQGTMSHMAATLNIDWLCDRVAESARLAGGEACDRATLLARLEALAAQAEPGAAMFHPFIADNGERGPFTEPLARAQFTGLSSGTGLAAMARAVWEGIAFATRDCYAALDHLPEEVRLTGGAAKSPLLRRILADVMGCPVRVSRRGEAGAAGAAIVAAVSIGRYRDVTKATPRWVDALLEPEATPPGPHRARYDALFTAYRDGYLGQFAHWKSLHHARSTPS